MNFKNTFLNFFFYFFFFRWRFEKNVKFLSTNLGTRPTLTSFPSNSAFTGSSWTTTTLQTVDTSSTILQTVDTSITILQTVDKSITTFRKTDISSASKCFDTLTVFCSKILLNYQFSLLRLIRFLILSFTCNVRQSLGRLWKSFGRIWNWNIGLTRLFCYVFKN